MSDLGDEGMSDAWSTPAPSAQDVLDASWAETQLPRMLDDGSWSHLSRRMEDILGIAALALADGGGE